MSGDTKHTPTPWHTDGRCIRADAMKVKAIGEVPSWGIFSSKRDDANRAFIVRAVNSHDELVKALEAVEWGQGCAKGKPNCNHCPTCDRCEGDGHAPDCLIGLALKGAD